MDSLSDKNLDLEHSDQFNEKDIEQIFGGVSVTAEASNKKGESSSEGQLDQSKQQEQFTHASDNIS